MSVVRLVQRKTKPINKFCPHFEFIPAKKDILHVFMPPFFIPGIDYKYQ